MADDAIHLLNLGEQVTLCGEPREGLNIGDRENPPGYLSGCWTCLLLLDGYPREALRGAGGGREDPQRP